MGPLVILDLIPQMVLRPKYQRLLVLTLCAEICFVTASDTPIPCQQSGDTIHCDNIDDLTNITVPNDVKKVYLRNFNISTLENGVFAHSKWQRVEFLDISDTSNEESRLNDKAFEGLTNLKHLGIHHMQLFYVFPKAFYHLPNLETLDFSGNNYAPAWDVFQSLANADMPNLDNITLNMLQSFFPETVNLLDQFFYGITQNRTRRIRYLDISNMNIGIADYNMFYTYDLCDTLEHFSARNSTFQNVHHYIQIRECSSLQRFDISGAIIPITRLKIDFKTTNFFCAALMFYFTIKELNLDNIFHTGLSRPFFLNNFTLDMSPCPMSLKKVTMSRNQLKIINASVILNQVMEDNFDHFDVSQNILEYISPKLLSPSINLKHLDISDNQLHVMQEQYPSDLEILVQPLTKLRYLGLANNGFRSLPKKMFETTVNLRQLDLSGNNLMAVDFDMSNLKNLKVILMQENQIKTISQPTQLVLESIASNRELDNEILHVDLSKNPMQCTCEESDKKNIQWVQNHLGSILKGNQSEYYCVLDGKKVHIEDNAVEQLNEYCEWQVMKRNLLISLPIVAFACCFAIVCLAIFATKIRRKRKMRKYYSNVLTLIKHNLFPKKNLVFLSYSSEDDELVTKKILPTLETKLQQILSTDRKLVCTGDTGFRPGFCINEELIRCIDESAVTIIAASNNFCQKEWCKREIQETYDQNKPIIILMLENLDTNAMDPLLLKIFNRYTRSAWISDDNGNGYLKPDWPVFCEGVIGLAGQSIEGCMEMSDINQLDNTITADDIEIV